jgi:hypothetical protein
MKFDVLYMMQVFLIVSMVFSMLAYMALLYNNSVEELSHRIVTSGYIAAVQYTRKLNIADYVAFEKYGVWRYSGRF